MGAVWAFTAGREAGRGRTSTARPALGPSGGLVAAWGGRRERGRGGWLGFGGLQGPVREFAGEGGELCNSGMGVLWASIDLSTIGELFRAVSVFQ